MVEFFVYRKGAAKVEENVLVDELPKILSEETSFVWVDIEEPTAAEEESILANLFNFHPLTIEDCRLNHSQPKVDEFSDYLYFIVHSVRNDSSTQRFATKELDGYLGKNFVVTYHHDKFRSIDNVKRQVRSSTVACQRGSSFLLHQILDQIVDNYAPVIEEFDEYIIDLEDRIFDLSKPDKRILEEIVLLRRNMIRLKRVSARQLDTLYRMSHGEFPHIDVQMLPFYRDVYDHLLRVSDLADSYRELISGLMETYLSIISNRNNDVVKILTIISTIMLPLSLIAGIYGMNFEHMPELKTRFGYFVVLGIMALVAGLMLLYFWRKGWLSDDSAETPSSDKHDESIHVTMLE